jgi:hypothetical protein
MSKWTIKRFRQAEGAYEQTRQNWAGLTQDQRDEIGEEKFGLIAAKRLAVTMAKSLIGDAHARHTIEESAKVYLVLGEHGWEIDQVTMADANLPGQEYGPSNSECGHARGFDDECEALRDAAVLIGLPTGAELAALMNIRRYELPAPD